MTKGKRGPARSGTLNIEIKNVPVPLDSPEQWSYFVRRNGKAPKDVRLAVVLWTKGILGPDDVLGSVIDCFDEERIEQDWQACEECDRERVRKLMAEYRPGQIPFWVSGPLESREADHWKEERNRKYPILLRLLALEPSLDWMQAHRAEPSAPAVVDRVTDP